MLMMVPGLEAEDAYKAATKAVAHAQALCPKLTGDAASSIAPIYGEGYFGLTWTVGYLWAQNQGVRPFLMRSLAGKTIPMWVDDPTGTEAKKNPKAKRRVTESGRPQVLIFRKAATVGQQKKVTRKIAGGGTITKMVPASYPGAPGRIANREARQPYTTPGKVGGRIARGNIGIRWYFPGLSPRLFLQEGLDRAAGDMGVKGTISVGYNFGAPAT
jgi:hypothetical protein